jgi:hypothetical protein
MLLRICKLHNTPYWANVGALARRWGAPGGMQGPKPLKKSTIMLGDRGYMQYNARAGLGYFPGFLQEAFFATDRR